MPRQQLFQVVLLLVATLAASVRSDPLDNFPYRRDAILEYKPMQEHGSMNELQKRATCDPNNTDGCPDGYRPQRFDDPDYGKYCACVPYQACGSDKCKSYNQCKNKTKPKCNDKEQYCVCH